MRPLVIIMMVTIALVHLPIHTINAAEDTENPILAREQLFRQIEALYQIPWYFLGAIDQYERNVRNARRDLPDAAQDEPIAIRYPDKQWVGPLNPNLTDKNPYSIQLFGGLGVDGNDDGRANPDDGMDALMSTVRFLSAYGIDELSLRTAIWELYHDPKTVDIITHTAKIYATIGTMNLTDNHFPVSLHHNYTYRSTWGAKRGWGGRRIHEGTDVFANHGTPVYSTVYGYIEAKGWNKYGGWRIGVRDVNNNYHYYAHLGSFDKNISVGSIVKPGDLLGYVGNSGYGKPGTTGKFPPHLHYGMYKYDGRTEWSFDPYPYLRKWERDTRQKLKNR